MAGLTSLPPVTSSLLASHEEFLWLVWVHNNKRILWLDLTQFWLLESALVSTVSLQFFPLCCLYNILDRSFRLESSTTFSAVWRNQTAIGSKIFFLLPVAAIFSRTGGGNRASQIHLLLHSRCPKKLWHSKLNIVPPSGQSRPLFIYFWPFQTPIQFLQQMNVKTDLSR